MNDKVKEVIDKIINDLREQKIPESIINDLHEFIARASIPALEDLDELQFYQKTNKEGNTITTRIDFKYPVWTRPPYEIFKVTKDSDNKELNIEFSSSRERYHGAGAWSEEWKSVEVSRKREDKINIKLKETEKGYEVSYDTEVIFTDARNFLLHRKYKSEETDRYDKYGIQISEDSMEIDFDVQKPWGACGIRYVSMHNVERLTADLLKVKGVHTSVDDDKDEELDLDELRDKLTKAEPSLVMLLGKNGKLSSFKHCRCARSIPDIGLSFYNLSEDSFQEKTKNDTKEQQKVLARFNNKR